MTDFAQLPFTATISGNQGSSPVAGVAGVFVNSSSGLAFAFIYQGASSSALTTNQTPANQMISSVLGS
jgi:hypothetical protein